jgi:hypothetical protein
LSIELRLVKRQTRGRATCAHSCDFSADAVAYGIVSTPCCPQRHRPSCGHAMTTVQESPEA